MIASDVRIVRWIAWLEAIGFVALCVHGATSPTQPRAGAPHWMTDMPITWLVLAILPGLIGLVVAGTAIAMRARAVPTSVAALVIGVPTLGCAAIEVFLRTSPAGVIAIAALGALVLLSIAVCAHLGGRIPPPEVPSARVIRR